MSPEALAYDHRFVVRLDVRLVLARVRAMFALALSYLVGKADDQPAKTSVYGVKLTANYRDRTFRYCLYGTYGRHLSDYIAALDEPFVFLDIGANQGVFTLVAGRNRHCLHAVALEPLARTFRFLEDNTRLNGLEDKVTLLMAALSDRTGTAEIRIKPNHSGAASLNGHRLSRLETRETIALIDAEALGRHLPDEGEIVVKIDVEGHEEVVIAQLMGSSYAGRIRAVFYENDERWADPLPARKSLERAGFRSFSKFGVGRHYDLLAER